HQSESDSYHCSHNHAHQPRERRALMPRLDITNPKEKRRRGDNRSSNQPSDECHTLRPRHPRRRRTHDPVAAVGPADGSAYSHSMVAGGFEVTSSTTRLTAGISLTMRLEIVSSRSYGRRAQSAVMASSEETA